MTQVSIGPEGTANVTLNGSGKGQAQVGPLSPRETWQPIVASVSASSNTAEAQCKVFVGDAPTAANYVDGTLSGSTGDSTGHVEASVVRKGQSVWAVWSGGDPGAVATLKVTGTKTI